MADDIVLRSLQDHTATITLNRPKARNAINAAMSAAIEAALDWAEEDDEVWTIVLASSSDVFCAGADLKAIAAGDVDGLLTERGRFAGVVRRDRLKPMIAAVDGPALAGGCEIALACDLIVASDRACFGLPEVRRSLVATEGGLIRLPQELPLKMAMEIALTGEPISAARAEHFGMVNLLTEPGRALEGAILLATRVNQAPRWPFALRGRLCLRASEPRKTRPGESAGASSDP